MSESCLKIALASSPFSRLTDDSGEAIAYPVADLFELKGDVYQVNIPFLHRNRKQLNEAANYYFQLLDQTNQAIFRFLSAEQKRVLREELWFALHILIAKLLLDEAELNFKHAEKHWQQILYCKNYYDQLSESLGPEKDWINCSDEGKPLKYLGLTAIAPFLVDKIYEVSSGKAETIIQWMNEFNARRLYWVWGGGLLQSILLLLSDNFYHKTQVDRAISLPAPTLGYISWTLYYARFGLHLSLLIAHSIGTSEEEKRIPAWERFKTQWNERKFFLLNDLIWGTINLISFFWIFNYAADVLCSFLLLFDVTMSIWRFWEESTAHNAAMAKMDDDIDALRLRINNKNLEQEKALLEEQLRALERSRKKMRLDWEYKRYGIINDLVYSVGLLMAYLVYASLLVPKSMLVFATQKAVTPLIFGVVGAAACFLLNTVYAAVNGYLDIAKAKREKQDSKAELMHQLQRFKETTDGDLKKQLYLDLLRLHSYGHYQERLIAYQKIKLVRKFLVDVLVPPWIFASFLFLSFGAGIALFSLLCAIAITSDLILKRFEPAADALPDFNEKDYESYKDNLTVDALKLIHSDNRARFFAKKPGPLLPLPKKGDNSEGEGDLPSLITK